MDRLADEDYIASRILYLNNKLVPATCLANTAIEKYLKALLILNGVNFKWTHDIPDLCKDLAKNGLFLKLNKEYLEILTKTYNLRYPNLSNGFNLHINKSKFLVELDYSVFTIRSGFVVKRNDEKKVVTILDNCLNKSDQNLLVDNCYFGNTTKKDIFNKQTSCFDVRVLEDSSILQAYYETAFTLDDGKFDVIGLKPENV